MSAKDAFAWYLGLAKRENECLISHVRATAGGYAVARINGKHHYLHRLALESRLGRTLEDGELACHRCHRPNCINADHLYAGTYADNMRDMVLAGRCRSGGPKGEQHYRAKLTADQVREIRDQYAAGEISQSRLAERFGVSLPTISGIVTRRYWRSVA